MPHGMKFAELAYYNKTTFSNVKPCEVFNLNEIQARDTSCVFERHHYYPMDYFFFSIRGVNYFGRKTLSSLFLQGLQRTKKCDQITAPMIIGLVIRSQVTEKGVLIFHKPLNTAEKVFLFDEIKINPKIDIYFPFPVLNPGMKEHIQDVKDWDLSDDMADVLNLDEEHVRKYTIQFLSQFDLHGKSIFDPACSTGKFLGSIKSKFPHVTTIGQDINRDMIAHARSHSPIDQLFEGDSLYPCIPSDSVDFIFFRFLNLSVVTSDQALKLFTKISQCCRLGGHIIVFGFTPVLLSAEIFSLLNLEILQTIGHDKEADSVFQYYILKKNKPIPQIRYENFSRFKVGDLHSLMYTAKNNNDTHQSTNQLKAKL